MHILFLSNFTLDQASKMAVEDVGTSSGTVDNVGASSIGVGVDANVSSLDEFLASLRKDIQFISQPGFTLEFKNLLIQYVTAIAHRFTKLEVGQLACSNKDVQSILTHLQELLLGEAQKETALQTKLNQATKLLERLGNENARLGEEHNGYRSQVLELLAKSIDKSSKEKASEIVALKKIISLQHQLEAEGES
ncbi:uncharacterized protein LOC132068800 [Lycium ferocissimum]|uniref:uncharacterized protein LOC132068800 n=1 Tax=Lycium ferocissimum TaxID=112874 RepID=UPI002815B9D7|nr:uncharacterized protein LOC132068800 [Lycium ferocissimum]